MPTIGIDCRLAGLKHAGIGRYVANLVSRLPKLDSQINWVLFFSDSEQAQEVLPNNQDIPLIKIIFAPIKHYSLAEQVQLPTIFNQEKLDLLHVPHFNVPWFYKGKTVITIHDLLWHEYRGLNATTLSPWKYSV